MDLQSFCVENRKKVHSFSLLRQSVHSSPKMPQSIPFGMPVNGTIMEEHCFQNIEKMPCKAEVTFQCVNKNNVCPLPKKSCFDHFNKFSPFSFSKVVGGFVGSKSQGGSASREPHQVWDVILRQLVDTACQAPLNNSLHQCFNLGNSVSQSIFGQFSNVGNPTLGLASYIISRPNNFFDSKKMTQKSHNANVCPGPQSNDLLDSVNSNSQPPEKLSACNQVNVKNIQKVDSLSSHKQSYADVAKTHVTSKSESNSLSEIPSRSCNFFLVKRPTKRFIRKDHERERRNCNKPQNPSSQHQHQKKHPMPLERFDEPIPSKFVRDRFESTRHNKPLSAYKNKSRDSSYHSSFQPKDCIVSEEKKPRYNRSRNYNMRDRERKTIDLQVHEDIAYVCNMSEHECQNWRCDHNRAPGIPRGRSEFSYSRQHCFTKNYKNPVRLHSPPPRTFVINSENNIQKMDIDPPINRCEVNSVTISNEIPKICEKLDTSNVLELSSGFETLKSCQSMLDVLPERPRLISECSVDSEDSCIVFERDDIDIPDDYSSDETESEDTDSDSDCDTNSESIVEDCDEVDFQCIFPSTTPFILSERVNDMFSDHLKDVNKRWREENSGLSEDEKVPKKVHFASGEELTKVHPMIYWGFAYREARRGPWEEAGRDRCRFQMRISNAERELAGILHPDHRRKVWEERMCMAALV